MEKKVISLQDKLDSDMKVDLYLYLYNAYRKMALKNGSSPVPLSEYVSQLWENVEDFKREANRKEPN